MDISEQYVMMCYKATEIQDNESIPISFVPNLYANFQDWVTVTENNVTNRVPTINVEVYVPRQDQLPDILLNHIKTQKSDFVVNPLVLTGYSHGISLYASWHPDWTWMDTFEKLWLLYVMEHVYNKQWDSENNDWETI